MPNHAASLLPTTFVVAVLATVATSASALDGIDLNGSLEPVGEGECPRLVQIKNPFLPGANGQIGHSDADETWENAR